MKAYKFFRGLLKASAFATVMFVMQACYGAPHPIDEPNFNDGEETYMPTDSLQTVEETPMEAEAE